MSAILAEAPPAHGPPSRILTLSGLFWTFSYALLSIRGALFHDDWTRLVDNNRLLAITVGAGAYALVLRKLQSGDRLNLRAAVAWIIGATLTIMIVRLTVDQLMFDVPQAIEMHLLWSLTWSAYFALWVMGSVAFAPAPAVNSFAQAPAEPVARAAPVQLDNLELMIIAIVAEAAHLKTSERAELAARVLALGGYEGAERSAEDNERARLVLRIAARLSAV